MASEKDKIRVEEKLNDILPDVEKTQEKINETVFQINDVKKVNADLQLQAQRLNVELKDKVDIMDSRVKEVKSRKQMEVTEIAGKLEREYEDRVQKALATLREVYENQVKEGKNEFTKKYEKRVSDLQSALSKERYKNNSTGQGLDETNRRVTALLSKVKYLEEQREGLQDRIENMEEKLREQDSGHKRQTALDMEIAVYRKLVESEEDRLGIDIRDDSE
ncbi:lamin-C [Eurytemora carolleeae]|uniref:lamin-C n=1 Tax=Eurytemora carolleeae TaxID=1294199 RepID=UPI000C7926B9|nr:lamin-C [Eurytemora carolleeae]|eukprot:XP_023332383.1 lamin-C-like [Eurytemora affinis]